MCRTAGVDKLPKKKGKKERPQKYGGEETWEQILGHANAAFCSDHVFGFKAVEDQPKGWTAHYAC